MNDSAAGRAVWVVLVADRHADVEPVVFSRKAPAMAFALSVVTDYQRRGYEIENYGDATEATLRGWTCGPEGDYVSIQPITIDHAPEVPDAD